MDYLQNSDIIYMHLPFDDGFAIPEKQFIKCLEWLKFMHENGHVCLTHCLPGEMMANAVFPFRMDGVQGDEVFDLHGTSRKITNYMKRFYHGTMLEFSMDGNLAFRCTPEHPILIIRPYRNSAGRIFKPNWKNIKETKKASSVIPMWVLAKNVKEGDFFLCPTDLPTINAKAQFILSSHFSAKKINSNIQPDKELAWLFGLYIGDGGSNGKYRFQLTLNDKTDRSRLKAAFNILGVQVTIKNFDNYYRASVNSVSLLDTFKNWFGKDCYSKRIPEFLFGWGRDCLLSLVSGIAESDGSRTGGSKQKAGYAVVTTSQRLAYQLWQILVSLEKYPYLSEYDKDGETNFGKRSNSWNIWWAEKGVHHRTCYHAGYYCMPVIKSINFDYAGYVYNFSVAETESFMANGVVTHNCLMGISRSVTILAAFMHYAGLCDFTEALVRIKASRPADPAPAVMISAKQWLHIWPYDGSML